MKATHRIIDSVWTVEYDEVEGGIRVIDYSRKDHEGYKKEKELPQVVVVEDEQRKMTGVRFRKYSTWYSKEEYGPVVAVTNPQHVFRYEFNKGEF